MSRGSGGETVVHPFPPVFDARSELLILGSLPSVQSRRNQFYYGHPQNRFWRVLAALTGEPLPETAAEKTAFLLRQRIALWDVVRRCEITGSADGSIRAAEPNDLRVVLDHAPIRRLYANGAAAETLYRQLCLPRTGREIIRLPSTSPANAAFSLARLCEAWRELGEFGRAAGEGEKP